MEMYVAYREKEREALSKIDSEVVDFLEHLRANTFICSIVSVGLEWYQYEKLVRTRIARYFENIIIGDSADKTPDIEKAVADSESEKSKCVSIGDKPTDVTSAKRAGIVAIRIRQGKHASKPNVMVPDLEFSNIREVHEYFQKNIVPPTGD